MRHVYVASLGPAATPLQNAIMGFHLQLRGRRGEGDLLATSSQVVAEHRSNHREWRIKLLCHWVSCMYLCRNDGGAGAVPASKDSIGFVTDMGNAM